MATDRYDKAIAKIVSRWQEGWTLKDVATQFGLDPGNLDRIFRQRYGVTVSVWVRKQKQAYVLERLRDGGAYGYQIGSELGFSDDWAFYRWVKRAFGVSFAELRKWAVVNPPVRRVRKPRAPDRSPGSRKGAQR